MEIRTPEADMSYLICDEQLLGLEEYRKRLLDYIAYYQSLNANSETRASGSI